MELDGESVANYEQLKDLICKECDKCDRHYTQLEDKYNKLEQHVTHNNQQKNMAKRGQHPTNDGTGALKKNKSDEKNQTNKAIAQRQRFQATKLKPNEKTLKTKEEPSMLKFK